jgi:high affinity Mn2+ porin
VAGIDAGTFDDAADLGLHLRRSGGTRARPWTIRGGVFQLSPAPNGKITAVDFSRFSLVGESERRYDWNGRPGKLRLLGFANRGKMGTSADAVQLAGQR